MDYSKFDKMDISEIVDYVTATFHVPLDSLFKSAPDNISSLIKKYWKQYPKIVDLEKLFNEFKEKISEHMKKEDDVIFPAAIEYENINKDWKIDLTKITEENQEIINNTEMENDHEDFKKYLEDILELLKTCWMDGENISEFDEIKEDIKQIYDALVEHYDLEVRYLYPKWLELQEEIRKNIEVF